MELAAIVPLPTAVADNRAAAFLALAGQPSVVRLVRALASAGPESVVVAAAVDLVDELRETLSSHGLSSVGVASVAGPATRADCLLAALNYLEREAIPARHVLIGDIAQPLVSPGTRDRVTTALREGNAVVLPVLSVTDSVKAVDARGAVTETLDRSTLRAVQYPRGFAVHRLAGLLAQRGSGVFDEITETLRAGVPVTLVEGDPDGFRAELPDDADFVEAIITCRQ